MLSQLFLSLAYKSIGGMSGLLYKDYDWNNFEFWLSCYKALVPKKVTNENKLANILR